MPFLMGPDSGHYNVEVKYEKKGEEKAQLKVHFETSSSCLRGMRSSTVL